MNERKLATIRRIAEVQPIPNADRIEAVQVDGWICVAKKGEFKVGDLAIYIEIDSFVPTTLAPFLTPLGKKPHIFNNVEGERLRTVKLRGQLSQGLLLSTECLRQEVKEREDITELLGIQLWQPPLPVELRGQAKGILPPYIHKTDQERIQNIPWVLEDQDTLYEVSVKLDGSSITIFVKDGCPGVCSRNINLKLNGQNEDNLYIKTARRLGLIDMLLDYYGITNKSIAIQGELMGPGVQGNYEGYKEHYIFIFDIWDIDNQRYMDPIERTGLVSYFYNHCNKLVRNVPFLELSTIIAPQKYPSLRDLKIETTSDMLRFAETRNIFLNRSPVEGFIFKALDGSSTFKVINNEYLEKNDK